MGAVKHTRSRGGCIQCRIRKKKCDEVKPICTACLKRNINCLYKSKDPGFSLVSITTPQETHKISSVLIESVVGCELAVTLKNEPWFESLERDLDDLPNAQFINSSACPDAGTGPVAVGLAPPAYPSPYCSLKIKLPVDLTVEELGFFEYYCKKILPDLSILPQESNYYSKIYVPSAFKDPAVLLALVGWGCRMSKTSNLNYWVTNPLADSYFERMDAVLERNLASLDHEKFVSSLVCYMILVCMEISYGDTARWSQYFTKCFNMINKMPGDFKYLLKDTSLEGSLLAENFAYFDVLASQSNENGTFYPIADYRELFSFKGRDAHDPLQGCIRPLILLIGEIVSLLVEYNSLNVTLDLSECNKFDMLSQMMDKSSKLDCTITMAKPDMDCLKSLKDDMAQLEEHLTLFEVYQLSAQIYLREVIRKLPAVVLEMQVLAFNLREDIKVIYKSSYLRKSLAFPMLLLGTSSVGDKDRAEVKNMFEYLIQHCGYLSGYQKLWIVVQRIWELNKDGAVYVDWFKVTKELGWRLNLGR